jgi:hypothetical protein
MAEQCTYVSAGGGCSAAAVCCVLHPADGGTWTVEYEPTPWRVEFCEEHGLLVLERRQQRCVPPRSTPDVPPPAIVPATMADTDQDAAATAAAEHDTPAPVSPRPKARARRRA